MLAVRSPGILKSAWILTVVVIMESDYLVDVPTIDSSAATLTLAENWARINRVALTHY